jgi:hypothetical protein
MVRVTELTLLGITRWPPSRHDATLTSAKRATTSADATRFWRSEPRARVREYVSGLVAGLERKNGWTLAERAGEAGPDGMQRLLRCADELAARLPRRAWQRLSAGNGAKGRRYYDWAWAAINSVALPPEVRRADLAVGASVLDSSGRPPRTEPADWEHLTRWPLARGELRCDDRFAWVLVQSGGRRHDRSDNRD